MRRQETAAQKRGEVNALYLLPRATDIWPPRAAAGPTLCDASGARLGLRSRWSSGNGWGVMVILEARGLVKRYGRRIVLNGASLTVQTGEMVGISGGSGAGLYLRKSTGQSVFGSPLATGAIDKWITQRPRGGTSPPRPVGGRANRQVCF
jgi:hypothetical protein